jgi:hypothetical protein
MHKQCIAGVRVYAWRPVYGQERLFLGSELRHARRLPDEAS